MLLIRWFKHNHFMNNNIRKYLSYAAGEIVLVIAGILIALQINAWYANKQIENNLNRQLQSVAESISQDLDDISRLKRYRTDAIFESQRLAWASFTDLWYNREYVDVASNAIAASQLPISFVASTGAYRTLEASGRASHIDSDSLKKNLADYYATVERIVFAEREVNSYIRELMLKFQTETTKGLYKPFLQEPLMVWGHIENEIEDPYSVKFRDSYRELLEDTVTHALIRSGWNQPLLKEYERLLSLGSLLMAEIDAPMGAEQHRYPVIEMLDAVTGPASVFKQGRFEAHSLGFFSAPSSASFGELVSDWQIRADHLTVTYRGGDNWVLLYALAGPIDISTQKLSLDYSRFDRIQLVLKRHSGCENLRLTLKDVDDADDGSQANVKLDLSDDWKTYEYDLSLFSDADLSKLNLVSGFLMDQTPCSFSIRDVAYLQPEKSEAE